MPQDATNMPFQRDAAFRDDDSDSSTKTNDTESDGAHRSPAELATTLGNTTNTLPTVDTLLKAENILLEEFNYASVNAYQAKETSVSLFNLYLLAAGGLITGLGVIANVSTSAAQSLLALNLLETVVLIIGGVLSFAFFAKLFSLRQEHLESMITMNVIKEFYIRQLKQLIPQIEQAFRWRLTTIPRNERTSSTFVISCTIALLGSLCFAGATWVGCSLLIYIITPYRTHISPGDFLFSSTLPYILSIPIFVIAVLMHFVYYRVLLRKRSEERDTLEEEAEKFELKISGPLPASFPYRAVRRNRRR